MAFKKTNSYEVIGDCAVIDVSTPKHADARAVVSLLDIALVVDGNGKWTAYSNNRALYAERKCIVDGMVVSQYMHRHILGLPSGSDRVVDHIDRDGLNNRRCNLRSASKSDNAGNTLAHKDNVAGFKGVSRLRNRWRARIDSRHIGTFDTREEAARAYDAAALVKFGAFARTNYGAA